MDVKPLFDLMVQKEASDLFLTVGSPICIKVKGKLERVAERALARADIDDIIASVLTEEQLVSFRDRHDYDLSLSIPGVGRFRVNVFMQRNAAGLVARRIAAEILTLEQLKIPPVVGELSMLKRGMVLAVGGTGSGKSTTLAAMVDHRNSNEAGHILTLEDPIEYMHEHKMSIVNQREMGADSKSYHTAIRGALRQAPDVLLIGEIRDRESMEAAIGFAETGHLVLSTLHSNSAAQTLERIMGFFPRDMHNMMQLQLSQILQGVIAQRLIPRKDGESRVAALEIMHLTARASDLIRKGEYHLLKGMIETSENEGMISFDSFLYQLYKDHEINFKTAISNSDSPTDLSLKIRSDEGFEITSSFHFAQESQPDREVDETL